MTEPDDLRRSFAHRALLWLMLAGVAAAALATTVHYQQAQAVLIDLIIPPAFAGGVCRTGDLSAALPATLASGGLGQFQHRLARGGGAGLVLPVVGAHARPATGRSAATDFHRDVAAAADAGDLCAAAPGADCGELLSWSVIAIPILGYLGLHPEELTSPRGHDLAMTLGPVMVIMVIYIGFQRNIEAAMSKLRKREEELSRLAERDALTGLYNRRAGESYLLKLQAGLDRNIALILFDIDHFKRINDQYGHPLGDAVLREVATRCTTALRPTELLARWGGEEFLVLASVADPAQAAQLAEHLRLAVCAVPIEPVGTVSASFGVSILAADESQEQALQRVDNALYQAKRQGRNCVCRLEGSYAGCVALSLIQSPGGRCPYGVDKTCAW